MQFNVDGIRALFSKCNIVITPSSLVASISDTNCMGIDDFPNQSDENSRALALASLIDSSDSFSVQIDKGRSIAFRFCREFPVDKSIFYPRLEVSADLDELEDMLLENIRTSKSPAVKAFADFFRGTDLSDEMAVVKKFREYMDAQVPIHTTVSLASIGKWDKMLATLNEFDQAGFVCDREINKPNIKQEYYGSFLLFLDKQSMHQKEPIFEGRSKDVLVKMILMSSVTEIELSVENGICNMVFYA